MLRAPSMEPEARIAALEPFLAEGAPYRLLALEARAVARIEAGDLDGAREDLAALLVQPGVTAEMRERAGALQAAIGAAPSDAS